MGTQQQLEDEVEAIELYDSTPDEVASIAQKLEGMTLRKQRKALRYLCYRLKTQDEGGPATPKGTQAQLAFLEEQDGFDGWRNFSMTWDVSLEDPMTVVSRKFSVQEEWERVVRAKFPVIGAHGKIEYPDKAVKEKMDQAREEYSEKGAVE